MSSTFFFFSFPSINTDQANDRENIFSKTLKENKQSNMSNGSMVTVGNGQSLSDLFHKFVRMTVKTDDREGRFKKHHTVSKNQQKSVYNSPNSQRSRRLVVQATSRVPAKQQKRTSTVAYYNVSPITTENNSYVYTDDEEQDSYYSYYVRVI